MMLRYRDEFGPEALRVQRKAPLTHSIICAILAVPDGDPVLPRGRPWQWTSYHGRSVRTAIHFAAQSGVRKSEIATHAKSGWGKKDYSFHNLTWRVAGKDYPYLTLAQHLALTIGDYAVVTPATSKADQFGMRWGNRPIWLPYHPTAAINAARAFSEWEIVARIQPGKRHDTPLFCGVGGVWVLPCLRQNLSPPSRVCSSEHSWEIRTKPTSIPSTPSVATLLRR